MSLSLMVDTTPCTKTTSSENIPEEGYRMFPNLWIRVMSTWLAMMAVFC